MKNITNYRLNALLLFFFLMMSVMAANAQTGTTYGCYINSPPHILTSPGDVRIVSSVSDCIVGETAISWDVFPVGNSPAAVSFDGTNIWVSNQASNTITKLRASDGATLGTFPAGPNPGKSVFDGENIWITNYTSNTLTKLRASDGSLVATIPLRGNPAPYGLLLDGNNIWVSIFSNVSDSGSVSKLRLSDGVELSNTPNVIRPVEMVSDGTNIWVTNNLAGGTITKISRSTGTILGVFLINGGFPGNVAFDGSNIWTLNSGTRRISKIRSSDSVIVGDFPMGIDPAGITFDGTNMWVANEAVVLKYRASDGALLGSFPGSFNGGGSYETGVALDGTHVWVSNRTTNTITRYRDYAVSPPTPPSDAIRLWEGDGNANDSIGSNHGSLQNGASFDSGRNCQAFNLDGVNDYVQVPDSPSLNLVQQTLSAWVYLKGMNGLYSGIIVKQNSNNTGRNYYLGVFNGGYLHYSIQYGGNYGMLYGNSRIPLNTWTHVAATYDGSSMKTYINGQVDNSLNIGAITPQTTTQPLTIGWTNENDARYFYGRIDEARIYDRALNASELQEFVNEVSNGQCPANLVGSWQMDGDFADSVGTNNPSATNAISFETGKICQGVSLSPGVGYIEIPDSPSLRNQSFSVSAWVKPEGAGPNDDLFGSTFIQKGIQPPAGDTSRTMGMWWSAQDNRFRFGVGSPTNVIASANIFPAGQFYNVTGTYDGARLSLYVNGSLEAQISLVTTIPYDTSVPWTIGSSYSYYRSIGFPRTWNGVIDEVQIFNGVLNTTQIQEIFTSNTIRQCPVFDPVAPISSILISPQPNSAGWNNSNVAVSLSASDDTDGSGVKEITYSATGAQNISQTVVSGASTNFMITVEGETTITYYAEDNAGNVEETQTLVVRIDKTAPAVSCGAADTDWHASDVSIACTAYENISQLENVSDANFNLVTSVPADTETANSSTDSREVCDVAGNCATADSIGGNKIDKKAPVITITAPTNGNYLLNQSGTVEYSCTDGGSGVANCTGTTPNGGGLDTSSTGAKTFTVNSADNVGNTASPTIINYTVGFGIQVLFDQTKAHKSGSTVPIKIRLVDANGANVSSAETVVHAVSVIQIGSQASTIVEDSGSSNPDFDFRYDQSLGGYIFNLQTKGYGTGTYQLNFIAGNSPTVYSVQFQVRQ